MATSVTFEQESAISPTKWSFKTIQRVQTEPGTHLENSSSTSPMVLWWDYLIGSYSRPQRRTKGLFLWSTRDNSICYFEVCRSFFPYPGALKPNSRQMEFVPICYYVIDDLLFTHHALYDFKRGDYWSTIYRCIHIPSLVTSTQLPGGALSLTQNAFAVLLPKCIIESRAPGSPFFDHTRFYSVPACPPLHPRYCFVIERFPGRPLEETELEVLEVEIDLSIPGPIKIFNRVSRQYTVHWPTYPFHASDDDLHLYLQKGRGGLPCSPLSVRFLQVGNPGKERLTRLGGLEKTRLTGLSVDRGAGYVIFWATEDWHGRMCTFSFICWLDERKPGNKVYSRTKELISSWSRGLLRHF